MVNEGSTNLGVFCFGRRGGRDQYIIQNFNKNVVLLKYVTKFVLRYV